VTRHRHIIFINRFFYPDHSATSQLLSDLAFHVVKKNYRVSVICSHQIYDNSSELLPSFEQKLGVNIHRIVTSNFGRHWLPGRILDYLSYFVGMSWVLFKLLKCGDTVVVKTDPPLTSIFVWVIAKIKRADQVNWIQDLFPEVASAIGFRGIPTFLLRGLIRLRNHSFRYSKKNIVIGELMKEKVRNMGVPESTISMIPNWSDAENIVPISRKRNPLRKTWGLAGKFVVGYSGNMGRVHEFDTMISAANMLREREDIVFVFIGGGAQKSYVVSKVKTLMLPTVKFFPYQPYDSLSYSLSLPDVHLISLRPAVEGYCVPSKYYGIIASATPAIFIGDEAGEVSRLLRIDQCGFHVNCGDAVTLSEQIVGLSKDNQRLNRLAENAKASFDKKYEKNIALKKWLTLLEG